MVIGMLFVLVPEIYLSNLSNGPRIKKMQGIWENVGIFWVND